MQLTKTSKISKVIPHNQSSLSRSSPIKKITRKVSFPLDVIPHQSGLLSKKQKHYALAIPQVLFNLILDYLKFINILDFIPRVCKSWHIFYQSYSSIKFLNFRYVNLNMEELYQLIHRQSSNNNILAVDLRGCMIDDTVIHYLGILNKLQVLFLQSGQNITTSAMVTLLSNCKQLRWIRLQGKMLIRDKLIKYFKTHKTENNLSIMNKNGQFLYDSMKLQMKKTVKRILNRLLHKMGTGKGKRRKQK